MGNCLLKKLKSSVDNDTLKKFGELTINVNAVGSIADGEKQQAIELSFTGSYTITATGDGYISESLAGLINDPKKTLTESGTTTIYVSNATFELKISNKYNCGSIKTKANSSTNKSILSIDLAEVAYLPLITLSFDRTASYGNIENLNSSDLANLNLRGTSANGNFGLLGKFHSLNTVNISNSQIEGIIEEFVVNRGIVPESPISINGILTFASLGGKKYANASGYSFLSWESNTKIFVYYGASSYDSCTTIYCKGYTQEEAETKWPNKTIIRVEI